jgi:hypothetical protein
MDTSEIIAPCFDKLKDVYKSTFDTLINENRALEEELLILKEEK